MQDVPDAPANDAVCLVHATLHRPAGCGTCGANLPRGARVRVGLTGGAARFVVCPGCPSPAAALVRPVGAAPLERGSLAVWIAVTAVGALAPLCSRTTRRALTTAWAGAKAVATVAWARVRGKRGAGPAAVRAAFEDLGPTYVKLGQLVASSQGLFPEAYCLELRKCLDQVRPFPFADVERTLREELGRDPTEIFAWIDPRPLASASIAQVHAARLASGDDVVVKVQRPRVAALVAADLSVLRVVARLIATSRRGELANPAGVVEDFEANLREELDFRREAGSMTEFNRVMAEHGQTQVAAPRPVDGLVTARVLVMERFFGHRVDDIDAVRGARVDGEERLLVGMRAWFQCLILHGFFHGDVHAGNLMALTDGRVGFLDFGIVGRFTRQRREQITDYLMAFATGDFRKLAGVMAMMGAVGVHVDLSALARDLAAAYEPILASDAAAVKYADLIPAILRTSIRHRMRMPREFVLVTKQMLYFDRYAKVLAPELNVFRDPRIVTALTIDVMAARMQPA